MKNNETAQVEKYLEELTATQPHTFPVLDISMETIGTITFLQGKLTHINERPVSDLCEHLGVPSLSVPAAVNYIQAMHERKCARLH